MSSIITRRNFLKTSGAVGAGLTILTGTGAVYGKNTKRQVIRRPVILNSRSGSSELGTSGNADGWAIL
ncbi:hypothetical protein AMJ80_00175, partial [bacterium SM23_31]